VQPGYEDYAEYDPERDGQLFPILSQTPFGAYYAWALLPHWQKFMPTHRFGEITSIDRDAHTAEITLQEHMSRAQGIDINFKSELSAVTFRYMSCDDAAFEVGDFVLIQFEEKSWDTPVVVGFKDHPKSCGSFFMAYVQGDVLYLRVNQHTRSIDLEAALEAKHLDLGFPAVSFEGMSDVLAVNFADEWPFRIGVIAQISPHESKWAAGRYAVIMIDVDTVDLSMSVDDVYYYSLLQDIGSDNYRITDCTGDWASSATGSGDMPIDLGDIPHENTCSKVLEGNCTAGEINGDTNCHTYLCCHRYYCPSTGEYADCSADPCNGECYLEHNGAPVGYLWCGEGEECIDLQEHYHNCGEAFDGDPCGSYVYRYPGCTAETCETWSFCGTSEVTVTPEAEVEPYDCMQAPEGIGPIPFGLWFERETVVPKVYLYGSREATGLMQTFNLAGTECLQKLEECGCIVPYTGVTEEHLAVIFPPDINATPGVDIWKADASSLYGEYVTGSRLVVMHHDGYVTRKTNHGFCDSNDTTINVLVLTNMVGLGSDAFSYNELLDLWNHYTPGGWEYESLGYESESYGVAFTYPGTPEGEDPDDGFWIMFNGMRDSDQGMSFIYDWGSQYFRSTNSLGHGLSLTPGLDSPLDDYNRVACLISNRDDEGNPGFAICTSAGKVVCYSGWRAVEPEGPGDTTLSPSGGPAYTWNVGLPLSHWRKKAAFFCGSIPGIIIPP
jgi:hypothetical protein